MIQEWMWMALALLAITFAGTLRSLSLTWVSLVATLVGGITWANKTMPDITQLLIFAAVTLPGVAIVHFFIKPRLATTQTDEDPQSAIKAPSPRQIIHRSFTLTEPIVNGFGQIEINGVTWRVRGEDSAAGEQIHVLGVDGLERDLLIVTRAELAEQRHQ